MSYFFQEFCQLLKKVFSVGLNNKQQRSQPFFFFEKNAISPSLPEQKTENIFMKGTFGNDIRMFQNGARQST